MCFLTSGKIRDVVTSPACTTRWSWLVTVVHLCPSFRFWSRETSQENYPSNEKEAWPGLVHDWITGGNKMRFNESSPLHSTRRGSSSSSSSSAASSRPSFLFSFFFFAPLRSFRIVFPYIENKSTMETTTSPRTCYCFTPLSRMKRCDRFFVCRWGNCLRPVFPFGRALTFLTRILWR